jgi:hypothetical protein
MIMDFFKVNYSFPTLSGKVISNFTFNGHLNDYFVPGTMELQNKIKANRKAHVQKGKEEE